MIKEITDIDLINNFLSKFDFSISNIGVYSKYYIYTENEEFIGFINYDIIYDRAEIEFIYTVEKYRRKNIASKLLDNMVEKCKKNNCKNITLEVRESNIPAISFYEKKGFKKVSIRSNYYKDENGILMIKELI